MAITEISSGLIVRNKRLLMVFDDENQTWNVPSVNDVSGEICATAAERASTEITGCSSEVVRYQGDLKTRYNEGEKEFLWQPYIVDIEGEPENGEWVPISEIESKELSGHLHRAKDKILDKF